MLTRKTRKMSIWLRRTFIWHFPIKKNFFMRNILYILCLICLYNIIRISSKRICFMIPKFSDDFFQSSCWLQYQIITTINLTLKGNSVHRLVLRFTLFRQIFQLLLFQCFSDSELKILYPMLHMYSRHNLITRHLVISWFKTLEVEFHNWSMKNYYIDWFLIRI